MTVPGRRRGSRAAGVHGRPQRFEDVVRLYAPALFAYCRRRLGEHHLAEDAVQETFLRACRRLSGRAPENLPGWLFATARRCCQEIRRRRGRAAERGPSLEALGDPPADATGGPGGLDELLESLDDTQRGWIYLKHVQGLTCREIAEATGRPIGTVSGTLARIYAKIRARIAVEGH